MMRTGTQGRPALDGLAAARICSPKRSRSDSDCPARARRENRCATEASICLLPRQARGQDRQRIAQIDHVVESSAKEIFGGGVSEHAKNSQKLHRIGIEPGRFGYPQSPQERAFMRVVGILQDRPTKHVPINPLPPITSINMKIHYCPVK